MRHDPAVSSNPRRAGLAPLLLAAAVVVLPCPADAAPVDSLYDAHADHGDTAEACVETSCGPRCQQALDRARRATAAYIDGEAAVERGYVADSICVAVPGVGGMGVHYVSQQRMTDGKLDPRFPEILVYEEQPNGERWLVALEYFAPVLSGGTPWFGDADEPPPSIDNPAPVMFGRPFNGPMPGHAPGMPWHYDLHVWAWKHNPAGDFAQFNPRVTCE